MTVEYLLFSQMDDEKLIQCLKQYDIGLSVIEARQVVSMLQRDPTIIEAIIFGIQGSEHASYKSTRKHLQTLPTKGPNVILGPSEDSGIIKLCDLPGGDAYGVIVSHESHNSPSQVVPYEGAATGVGGIIRDIICMGGKAIATLDPLRFGSIHNHKSRIIAEGCIEGIAGYGNPIGVPNLGGDLVFDKSFEKTCLVNVVAYGLIRESHIIHSYAPKEAAEKNYDIIIVGKGTDNSGFGGSTFSSQVVDESKQETNKAAVQEPNPFLERHIMASSYSLFKKLQESNNVDKVGFKDMGAGGILCATVELVSDQGFGAKIDVEKIHTSIPGLKPEVIACSETQERFAWVCHPDLTEMILDHYNNVWELPTIAAHAGASHVGTVTSDGIYRLEYKGEIICDAKAKDITQGLLYDRCFTDPKKEFLEPSINVSQLDINSLFIKLLASENIASRQPVYEHYDSTVQGNTIIEAGEADAGVIAPLQDEDVSAQLKNIGVAITADGSGRYGLISPYWQAVNAVVESMRNVAAVGAVPQCLTDCLNYGNPETEEGMWELIEGIRGVKEAAEGVKLKGYDNPTPIISGNVSLYKPVAPSAIVSCLGKIEDVSLAITQKLKRSDSQILLIGKRKNELGASEFYKILDKDFGGTKDSDNKLLGANVPQSHFQEAQNQIYALTDLVSQGLILSAHDISEGGLAICLAEMCMPHQKHPEAKISINIDIQDIKNNLESYQVLFTETPGFVLEVASDDVEKVINVFEQSHVDVWNIGKTNNSKPFTISDNSVEMIQISLQALQNTWMNGLREKFL
jgi:phosphoribosylformylglycinamidine synthase subunit PurL